MSPQMTLPHFNVGRGAVIFMLRPNVRRIFNELGKERVAFLIETGQDLSSLVPENMQEQYRQAARPYAELGKLISDDDLFAMLPDWSKELIKRGGEQGWQWFKRLVSWVRSLLV